MKYTEITVHTTSEGSELVAYYMQEATDGGVTISDKADLESISSWDYADENILDRYGKEVTVTGYCLTENTASVLSFLHEKFMSFDERAGSLDITVSETDGGGWDKKWKENFKVLSFGETVICPVWLTPSEEETKKKVLYLDTGISFGTGQHETTAMCLDIIDKLNLDGANVLDAGCGSGILGLSALLHGANSAVLADVDLQACETAVKNAALNGFSKNCEVLCGDLSDTVTGQYDFVFANLTAEILVESADVITSASAYGGVIVLSGILCDRTEKVLNAFLSRGFDVTDSRADNEWRAFVLERV